MGKILEQLGIYGIPETIENSILASLTLGDPALLIGAPGTAKTDTVQMIGSALREQTRRKFPNDPDKWMKFAIYDASKLEYEDLLGIPNPEAMRHGKMEFIETPTTVWGKTLVCYDEFNRTNPDRQSNLLEHIRTRKIQGIPTGTKFVLAAMNPYGDTGTEELSDALVDRFLFYLEFPEFHDFKDVTKDLIIERVGQSDCVALKHYWKDADTSLDVQEGDKTGEDVVVNEKLAEAGRNIGKMIQRSMALFGQIQAEMGDKITNLVRRTFDSMNGDMEANQQERVSLLSGRRGGLVRRGLLAHRAVELAKSEIYGTKVRPMIEMLRDVYVTCMPFGVSGRASGDEVAKYKTRLYDDISSFWPVINSASGKTDSMTDVVYELFRSDSIHRQLYLLLKYGKKLSAQMETEAWTTLSADPRNDFTEILQTIATHMPKRIPENVQIPSPTTTSPLDQVSSAGDSTFTLKGEQVECKRDIDLLVEKWKKSPIVHFFVVRSLNKIIDVDNPRLRRETELRRHLDDISLAAAEVSQVVQECEREDTVNV